LAIQSKKTLSHWNYFLSLEEDLIRVGRFIEFSKSNYSCFSTELARLLLAASSEVDVVAKLLCKKLDTSAVTKNMDDYRNVVLSRISRFPTYTVALPRFGLTLTPWSKWATGTNPDWWREHNQVKHQRDEYFAKAHLKNTLNAIGGLFLLLMEYYRGDFDQLDPATSLFLPSSETIAKAHTLDGRTVQDGDPGHADTGFAAADARRALDSAGRTGNCSSPGPRFHEQDEVENFRLDGFRRGFDLADDALGERGHRGRLAGFQSEARLGRQGPTSGRSGEWEEKDIARGKTERQISAVFFRFSFAGPLRRTVPA
jgi:hypothetical protein